MEDLNIQSMRIGGKEVHQLPIAESAAAKPQMQRAIETQKANKIRDLLVSSPKQKVQYVEARIEECRRNVRAVGSVRNKEVVLISTYNKQISLCEFRDSEIQKLPHDEFREHKIKKLYKKYLPYNVEAMKQQIVQSEQSINRADAVIQLEQDAIATMTGVLQLCKQRDANLIALGGKAL